MIICHRSWRTLLISVMCCPCSSALLQCDLVIALTVVVKTHQFGLNFWALSARPHSSKSVMIGLAKVCSCDAKSKSGRKWTARNILLPLLAALPRISSGPFFFVSYLQSFSILSVRTNGSTNLFEDRALSRSSISITKRTTHTESWSRTRMGQFTETKISRHKPMLSLWVAFQRWCISMFHSWN